MDKRTRAALFRERLSAAMRDGHINKSRLATLCGVDRSTIAQVLAGEEDARLPNAHLAAACAATLGVSVDWLLGLSERSETATDLLSAAMEFKEAPRSPADEQLIAWRREAAGYKIRYVPTRVPDLLKTESVVRYEYEGFLARTPEQAERVRRDMIDWMGKPGSDYEICASMETFRSLALGEGFWRGLPRADRRQQLRSIAEQCRQRYPSLRLYLYDEMKVYSAPITVFGPLLAVVYIGRHYMAFRETRQVRAIAEHFDDLVRHAETDARSAADVIDGLIGA